MSVRGRTWRTYVALLGEVAAWAGAEAPSPTDRAGWRPAVTPLAEEEILLNHFSQALQQKDPRALGLLERLDIGPKQFRCHLRYIARWSAERRQLLADGGNFQLLEGLKREDAAGRLRGLKLSGTRAAQERALTEHLQQYLPVPQGEGWLAPVPNPGKPVREYGPHEVVWLYPTAELQREDDLHPSVARSLIRRYLPAPGIVADPMAGSGTVAQMATLMGHGAWASDIEPRHSYIVRHDIRKTTLEEVFGAADAEADLVFVHPPTAEELGMDALQHFDWLSMALINCWSVVSYGGHVVLVVGVEEEARALVNAEKALLNSAADALQEYGLLQPPQGLTARHLAAARDGRQGWHILVLKRPRLAVDED